jgi:multiple sugar transport system permease protein
MKALSPSEKPATQATLAAAPIGRSARRAWRPAELARFLYLLPMVALVGAFLLYPAADTFWVSFTNWNGLNNASFIGFQNYSRLFSDPAFSTSFTNTLIWVGGILVLQVGLGLLMAIILSDIWGSTALKTIFYLPATISAAATGVLWYFMFDPNNGVINTILRDLHLGGLTREWLSLPTVNTYAMVIASIWQTLGPTMMLFLVGLQNIPTDPIEAARLDGANGWQLFRYITLPLLRPMATVVIGISLINSFKVFDLIWVMTQGGPYRSSETLAVTMYREAFVSFRLGYGASVAVVLSLIVLVISIFYLRAMFRRDAGVY